MAGTARRRLSAAAFVLAITAVTAVGLAADQVVDARGQAWLGMGCTVLFVAVAWRIDVHERRQALGVMAVATVFEVVGARLWGLYDYRLGNLPLFVPAGHGLVFLTGLRLSQVPLLVRHRRAFIRVTAVAASVWAVLGAAGLLGTRDLSGVVGSVLVILMLFRSRQAGLFAGVWWFVAILELYGTGHRNLDMVPSRTRSRASGRQSAKRRLLWLYRVRVAGWLAGWLARDGRSARRGA